MRSAGMSVQNQLLERVLDDAPGERFRGVVARRLLTITPGQAVDERTLRMHPELLPALPRRGRGPSPPPGTRRGRAPDEPSAREVVRGVAGLLHLVEVLLGEEAAVGEQRLVDRAQLVDAELGVGDATASPPPALRRTAQRHQADHLLKHPVAELHPVQQRHRIVPEQPAVQRADGEAVGRGPPLANRSPPGPSKPSRISRNRVWMLWCR